jgi:hypothetical protein
VNRLRRLWSWIRRVATDTGEHARQVPIDLERNRDGGYAFRLGVRAGLGGLDTARIPVARRTNPAPHPILKEIHYCEVAGQTLEAANVYALKARVATLLETIAPGHALPLCYFRVPEMDYELPVYEEGERFVSPVIGGPNLKAPDLAEMRRHMCRHMISSGYVSEAEEVAVGVLRPRDLSRVDPAAVFRSYADPELWLPSVEGVSAEGPVVGVLGHATQLGAERARAGVRAADVRTAPSAPDVVELLRFLRVELVRGRALEDPSTLYASEVRPEIWAAAEVHTQDTGRRLVAYMTDEQATKLELAIRRTGFGEVVTALEDRGIDVLLAPDDEALAAVAGNYLAARGFLRFASEVEIHAAEAPRAERLEPDDIFTSGDGPSVASNEPQEVQR